MSTRSDRARRRAARLRNQRITLVVILGMALVAAAYFAFFRSSSGSGGDATNASGLPDLSGLTTTASGLGYKDLKVGNGDEAIPGKTVSVHYTGMLQSDGAKFDSSLDRGEPFEFPLGAGRVIAGWDEGVAGMKEGGKRILVIPAELGYGATGAGGVIPPNATLVFEVELLEVK